MVLSAVVFADVSGCRVKASVAGMDEGAAGDQVRFVPLAQEVSRGLPDLHWVCFVTCFGDSGTAADGLWSSLVSLSWGQCSSAALQLGRLDGFEGKVGKGRWCQPALGGVDGLFATAAPATAGGSLPITGSKDQ